MDVEIDASGKIERKQRMDMAVAFANGKSGSILIPQKVKDQAFEAYKRHKRGKRQEQTKALLLAIFIYLLLRDHISSLEKIIIDREYKGHEALMRQHIINLFGRQGIVVYKDQIEFGEVGKKSPAHFLAWRVAHHEVESDRMITLEEIIAEF